MRAPALVGLGAAAYAVFLLGTMPASFVLARAQQVQPGKLEVLESTGTAWRGSAKLAFNTPGGPIAIDRVQWRWLPSRLVAARFAFDIDANASGIEARFEGARTLTHWTLRDLDVKGDAVAMAPLLPWLAAWRPEGKVGVTSPELTTDGSEMRGEAKVEWKGAAIALSEVKPLGSYRAEIRAEGHSGKVIVSTLEGALRIAGQGTLSPPASFAFTGEARADGSQAKALEPLLNLLGPARPDGARALDWRVN